MTIIEPIETVETMSTLLPVARVAVAVYVRVSTLRQAQAQTIEQQLQRLQAYVQDHNWTLPTDQIFRDDGYSGASLNRPGLARLREHIARGEVDHVLLTAPDRLARNYPHQVLLISEFEQAGCQVEFLDRPMNQDPHDQLVLQIRGAVAEYERSLIAERMRRGRQQKSRAGLLLPWTRPPFGYRVNPERPRDPKGVQLDEGAAALVAEIYTNYLQEGPGPGHSLIGLAKYLMAQGVPTPSGHWRWNPATVRGILTNPVYTGTVYAGRTRSRPNQRRHSPLATVSRATSHQTAVDVLPSEWIGVAQVPPIVTQEQFDLVQTKLAQNRQFATRNNKAHQYLLRALVSCGLCQGACTARTTPGEYAYYVCRGKQHPAQSHKDTKCPARYAPVPQLDELVWNDLCEVLTHPGILAQALQRAQGGEWLPQELQARRENLRKARRSLDQQLDRLTQAYLADIIPMDEYRRRRHDLEGRQQGLDNQAQQLEMQVDRQGQMAGLVSTMEEFCQRVSSGLEDATFEQKRQLVELLVDRVVVSEEEVEIRYVIPTSPSSEHVRFCHLRLDYFYLPMRAHRFSKLGNVR